LLLYPPIISVDKYENAVSPYGLYQTIGNVAEWVADWYDKDYYRMAPDRNPQGPETGTQKAFRGGGWMDSTTMRAAMRNGTDPNTKINWIGFRCAREPASRNNGLYPMIKGGNHGGKMSMATSFANGVVDLCGIRR
jgi:sulfatase-modifying factor enzyme 1